MKKQKELNPKKLIKDVDRNVNHAYDKGYKDGYEFCRKGIMRFLKIIKVKENSK